MTVQQVKNIWEKCPKSVEKLITWYKGQMPKPIGKPEIDVPIQEAFKHADKALQVSMSAGTPRFLYEFFDEQQIYVGITNFHESDTIKWEGDVYVKDKFRKEISNYFNRVDVENDAFYKAFEVMEETLND